MRTVTLPYYVDTRPAPDKARAPESDIERFMAAANLFGCELLGARITPRQCEINRGQALYSCSKCIQERPDNKAEKLVKRAKRGKGDNPNSPWRDTRTYPLEPPKADQSQSGQVRSGQVRSGQVRSGQVRSGQVRSGQVRSETPTLDAVTLQILQIMAEKYHCAAARQILKGGPWTGQS
ncbi:MAG: hypothetical protein A2075_12070 [Geobacteraceae bacterium GWC2_58_44]|nr:MAG: hypothetical protein A2075_12070 [Geobacteraceae bacterium GWC2_58_44]HBG06298.1 hypothetical protein [Geobacter sp.]